MKWIKILKLKIMKSVTFCGHCKRLYDKEIVSVCENKQKVKQEVLNG